jgi:chorismate mutase/prephenate dehydratase
MDLQDYRKQIDAIDNDLLRLFKERMDIVRQIALYKKEHGLPVLNAEREREILDAIDCPYAQKLYRVLFELSREYQGSVLEHE